MVLVREGVLEVEEGVEFGPVAKDKVLPDAGWVRELNGFESEGGDGAEVRGAGTPKGAVEGWVVVFVDYGQFTIREDDLVGDSIVAAPTVPVGPVAQAA